MLDIEELVALIFVNISLKEYEYVPEMKIFSLLPSVSNFAK